MKGHTILEVAQLWLLGHRIRDEAVKEKAMENLKRFSLHFLRPDLVFHTDSKDFLHLAYGLGQCSYEGLQHVAEILLFEVLETCEDVTEHIIRDLPDQVLRTLIGDLWKHRVVDEKHMHEVKEELAMYRKADERSLSRRFEYSDLQSLD